MGGAIARQLSEAERHEVSSWIATHQDELPEVVRVFFAAHQKYLSAGADLKRRFEETCRELRRALGITASSERRRIGAPLGAVPGGGARSAAENEEQRLLAKRDRVHHLGQWHCGLSERHTRTAERIDKRLERMKQEQREEGPSAEELALIEEIRVEDIDLTPEQEAKAAAAGRALWEHM